MKEARFCERCGAYIPTGRRKCVACGNSTQYFVANDMDKVEAVVFLETVATFERHLKRAWIALILAISMLVATNAVWVYYESQFDSVTYETVYEVEDNA